MTLSVVTDFEKQATFIVCRYDFSNRFIKKDSSERFQKIVDNNKHCLRWTNLTRFRCRLYYRSRNYYYRQNSYINQNVIKV